MEGDEYSDPDGVGPSAPGARTLGLVAGLDVSGLDNENGCCHLNSVIILLFSCRVFWRFFGPHDESPPVREEVWHHLIDLRRQMATLVPQSTLDLQFVLSQTPEFHGYFEGWQDAYDTFERLVQLLSQTEFGADLIPLMSVARLRHTRHACSVDPYVSMMQEGYIAVSEGELMRSDGGQSLGQFLRASAERRGMSLELCPCCHTPAEIPYVHQLVAVPSVLIVRVVRDWTPDGRDVRLRPVSMPVDFHFEEFDRYYRLSAAVCAHGSAARPDHYYAVVRTESNNWYVYDDARVKAVADGDDLREVTDTIYFCLFEQL
jgi:uncharacterized UBP type Zn finger protein